MFHGSVRLPSLEQAILPCLLKVSTLQPTIRSADSVECEARVAEVHVPVHPEGSQHKASQGRFCG